MLLCLVASAGFGGMAVLAKLAYGSGVTMLTLLSTRFALASAVLWLLVLRPWNRDARGHAGAALPPARTVLAGLALGALVYSAEAGLFFAALTRMGAGVTELLLYVYPAFVLTAAVLLGRERTSPRSIVALVVATAGAALVLLGGSAGSLDALGVLLALGAAFGYATYILTSDHIVRGVPPLTLAALVCTGATASFTLAGLAGRQLHYGFGAPGWLWIASIALVSTVLPIGTFLAGVVRVGPSRASIISTVEPVVTVALAWVAMGEVLGPVQVLGGLGVLTAIVVLQSRSPRAIRARVADRRVRARAASAEPLFTGR